MELHILLNVQLWFEHSDGHCLNDFEKASTASFVDNFERFLSAAAVSFSHNVFAHTALRYLVLSHQSPFWDVLPDAVIEASFCESDVLLTASTTSETIYNIGGGHQSQTVFSLR